MFISVAIPTHSMNGIGHEVLEHALKSLSIQKFKDFEVVISDQSEDYKTKELCDHYNNLDIIYIREEEKRGWFTANENNAIKYCNGDIIKFLDADDMLYDENSLQIVNDAFEDESVKWLVTDYVHTYDRLNFFNRHSPTINGMIYVINTLGTPSCVAVRNDDDLPLFDENLRWAGDCEWYKRLYDKYGDPKIVNEITAIHLLWRGQIANTFATSELQQKENEYIRSKYE